MTSWLLDTNVLSELRRRKPDRKNEWLTHRVRPTFAERVLPVSEDVLFKWRLLVEDGRKVGHTFSQPDLFIAATALHHGMTIVSRDVGDYARARVALFNPWVDVIPKG